MRAAALLLVISVECLAQSSGGSFGSGSLGGPSSSSGGSNRGSSGSGGSRSNTGSSSSSSNFGTGKSMFDDKKRSPPTPSRSPEEIAEAARRAEEARVKAAVAEGAWLTRHRALSPPTGVDTDPRVLPPFTTVMGFRPRHAQRAGLIGLIAFVCVFVVGLIRNPIQRTHSAEDDLAPGAYVGKQSTVAGRRRTGKVEARGLQVTLAFDWSVRRTLQAQLKELSRKPMESDRDRMARLEELLALVEGSLKAVRYAYLAELAHRADVVEQGLQAMGTDLRSRYTEETVGRVREMPKIVARPIEGEGLVVLSLLLGSTKAPDALDEWLPLDTLPARVRGWAKTLQMFNVVWSPAVDEDRLSSAELEVLYPELARVGTARLGRVKCTTCSAIYARELGQCPSCGAKGEQEAGKAPAPPCPYCANALPEHETKCETCGAFVSAEG